MRKRFEQQYFIGQKKIEDITVNPKCRDAFPKLIQALKKLFITPEYNEQLFSILEGKILDGKAKTGRTGMDLWQVFVLAEARLCLNASYDRLHDLANYHSNFRQILGIETDYTFKKITIEYQNIIDNVNLLDDATLLKINDIIVKMGHDVFKKKDMEALRLKTDSFVVKSNVHFPTDYNLLWDSARKCTDVIGAFLEKYPSIKGWRKLHDWYKQLKTKMREVSQSNKKGEEKKKAIVTEYLDKAVLFIQKLKKEKENLPMNDIMDISFHYSLEYFMEMLEKHIDLLDRRVLKGETIPHGEKIFSLFEDYTEWITKGKLYPNVELGKNVQITTDQFHLIIYHKVMEDEVDKSTVIPLADTILAKYLIDSWSFDKGFFTKENKESLSLYIDKVIMPKKGKLNIAEHEEEHQPGFIKLRNQHSAVESNINALENRGLDRCPDKGYPNFKRYVAMAVCAYNLHRIGAELQRQERQEQQKKQAA
jgi:hypothetical protein